MKNILTLLVLGGSILMTTACQVTKNQNKMTTETPIFPTGEKITNDFFTDGAYLKPLVARDKNNNFSLGNVTFEPGARTNWHTHPKGQVLLVTEGEGLYQQRGKPAQVIRKGDVINIPDQVEHWHGATAHSKMVHIGITNYEGEKNVDWLKPVSDDEYKQANAH